MDSSSGAAWLAGVLTSLIPPPRPSDRWGRLGVVLTPILGAFQCSAPKAFPQSPWRPGGWLISSEEPTRGDQGGRILPLPAFPAVGPAAADEAKVAVRGGGRQPTCTWLAGRPGVGGASRLTPRPFPRKGRIFRPRPRRNAEEMGLLERK